MSKVAIEGNASGTGTLTIAAPNTNTNRTLTIPDATTTIVGTDATQTLTNKSIVATQLTGDVAAARITTALNATGSAPIFAARAWVNFNGTGTVAINASGNVTSITDNGTGNYTVNFTTAMPDDDYAACYEGLADNADNAFTGDAVGTLTTNGTVQTRSTTAIRFNVKNSSMSSFDPATMSCMIFR